jgi:uncharacterized surface protein with fasciclin (FAS1) repeats
MGPKPPIAEKETPPPVLPEKKPAPEKQDLAATAKADSNLSRVTSAADERGLLKEIIKGAGPYTIFAPVNEAIEAVPADTWKYLQEHPEEMKKVLEYHAVVGEFKIADARTTGTLPSVQGANLNVTAAGDTTEVNGAQVIQADIECTNGIIHKINKVLLPPDFAVPDTQPEPDPLPAPKNGSDG